MGKSINHNIEAFLLSSLSFTFSPTMSSKKVKLAFVENQNYRKACFRKRKLGLLKKVEELSILCGVDACAILYGPSEEEPEIWPPSRSQVMDVISKFKQLSLTEQNRKMMNQEVFLKQMIKKTEEQVSKLRAQNREKEINYFIGQLLAGNKPKENFDRNDLTDIRRAINLKLKAISRRIELLKGPNCPPLPSPVRTPILQLMPSSDADEHPVVARNTHG